MKLLQIFLIIFIFTGCLSTNISNGDYPDVDKAIVFCGVNYLEETYYTRIYLTEISKPVRGYAEAEFHLTHNNEVEALFLEPGSYYFTLGSMGQVLFVLTDPKKVISVEENKINYAGTINMKYISDELIYKINYDTSDDSFEYAKDKFKLRFPELSDMYEFNDATK